MLLQTKESRCRCGQRETASAEDLPVGRESNGDTCSVRSEVLEGLFVSCTARGGNHSGVRTESVGAGSLDGLDDVLLLLKVNELVGAELLTQGLLLGSGVNGDDTDSLERGVPGATTRGLFQPPTAPTWNGQVSPTGLRDVRDHRRHRG